MKKFVILLSICFICFCCAVPKRITRVEAYSSAKAICLLDANSGRILNCLNENQKLPMASTTKIVTAITVILNCKDIQEEMVVDNKSVGIEGTSIYLKKGEKLKIIDLLYGLMLRSGNDAAMALAIKIGGSSENFTKLMQETAKMAGAVNSNFSNPHGLDDPNHYTTAYDLAKITAFALNNDIFKNIVSTKSYTIPKTNVSETRYLVNKNKLLKSLDGCCGVKTGFTSKAGRCLVSACERNNNALVCVVLNCGPMFELSAELINDAFKQYNFVKILDKNKEIYNEYVKDDKNIRLYLYPEEDVLIPLLPDELKLVKLKYQVQLSDADNGKCVGKIEIFLNKHLLKTVKLYTINKIDKIMDSNGTIENLLWEEGL